MESDGIITKGRFSYIGEILPDNERSNEIIAKRREEEANRKAEAERVSCDEKSMDTICSIKYDLCCHF